jgi:hypothetical protein
MGSAADRCLLSPSDPLEQAAEKGLVRTEFDLILCSRHKCGRDGCGEWIVRLAGRSVMRARKALCRRTIRCERPACWLMRRCIGLEGKSGAPAWSMTRAPHLDAPSPHRSAWTLELDLRPWVKQFWNDHAWKHTCGRPNVTREKECYRV